MDHDMIDASLPSAYSGLSHNCIKSCELLHVIMTRCTYRLVEEGRQGGRRKGCAPRVRLRQMASMR